MPRLTCHLLSCRQALIGLALMGFLGPAQANPAEALARANAPFGQVAPQFQLRIRPPNTFDTYRLGAQGAGRINFQIVLLNGAETGIINAPITISMTLPDGLTFLQNTGNDWSCTASGQEVSCVFSGVLSAAVWSTSLALRINVAGDIPVPGQSELRATLEHPMVPLPDPLICEGFAVGSYIASETGCVETIVPHRLSQTTFDPTFWTHSSRPMLVGATNQSIRAGFENIGFDAMHGQVTARFLIPPGLVWTNTFGSPSWSCSDSPAGAAGSVISCTTPSFPDGLTAAFGNISFRFSVTDAVDVPGPLTVIGTVGHAYQPWPEDFSECLGDEPPVGCSVYGGIQTAYPAQAQMAYTDFSHSSAFQPGQPGSILARFTNQGEASAGAISMHFAAPPGLTFTGTGNTSPSATCQASGEAASGQIISCSTGAGFGVGLTGHIRLHFDVAWPGALELPLHAAIGDGTRPGPDIESCTDDPNQVGCGLHLIPFIDSLFCDRFEQPATGCRAL